MSPPKVVIAGALGVVGRAAMEHLARVGWRTVGLSRRRLDFDSWTSFFSVDLLDRAAVRATVEPLDGVTHVVYAASHEMPQLAQGWYDREHVKRNLAMLRNLLDAVDGPTLRHVTLLQGTKAYGAHVRPRIRTPARESDSRVPHENFYFAQEDLLRERGTRRDWTWTILRPQVVLGVAAGSAMNVVATVGAYAAVRRELGRPLSHPGHEDLLTEVTDARLLARAIEWVATTPACAEQTFNVTDGDVIAWRDFWPRVADWFGMRVGEPEPLCLAREMPRYALTWRTLAQRERLRVDDLDDLIGRSWQYADMIWANPLLPARPTLVSTIKLRRFGFSECIDSEDAFLELLQAMRDTGYLPK